MHARLLLLALALAACGPRAPATTPPPPPAEDAIDARHLDAQLTAYIESFGRNWGERRRLSGFVIVARGDEPLYARAFGFADRERRVAATADTSFRIGSVTKQFTAAAILVLEQDGKLSTSDPVGKHLPDYTGPAAAVTIHQLLTHTGGVPSYTGMPLVMATRAQPRTTAELLATFAELPLEFPPGTRFAYSNSGYALLGAIIERVSGQPYGDFVRTRLFEPAGMTRTVYGDAEGDPDRALGYDVAGDGLAPATPIDLSVAFAAGGVRSTANDLVRWHRALEGDAILTAASKQKLYTPALEGYAYGWIIDDVDGRRVVGHGGGIDGFLTDYVRVPELDLVVVTWSNNTGVDPGPIGEAAVAAALGATLEPVDEPAILPFDAAEAARLAGSYQLTDASRDAALALGVPPAQLDTILTITLTVEDDRLVMKPVGQPAISLDPGGAATYLAPAVGVTLTAELPPDGGRAAKVAIRQGELTLEYAPGQ